MTGKRISMTKGKEILRLRIGEKWSLRDVATSVNCSASTVHDIEARFKASGYTWPIENASDEIALLEEVCAPKRGMNTEKALPDQAYIHKEMSKKGVSLHLLWQEYKEVHQGAGYQYSRFCDLYRAYQKKLDPPMRQNHKAGEKAFVDWSGDGVSIVDKNTGEVKQAMLFVGSLGASAFTFATVKEDRTKRNWISCHEEMYEYFGGVSELTIPDNEKTGVTSPCLYEPELNKTYHHMSRHYGTTIVPARAGHPKDKAQVENAVLNAQRWILASLRNHTFFSLAQANEAIAKKLEEYNDRPLQLLKVSRRELFLQLDKPALHPLPAKRYEYTEWSESKVHIDYHVLVDKHYYSVPYQYIGEKVSASRSANTIQIFYKEQRIAIHKRLYHSKNPSTQAEHMPSHHQKYADWSPERFLNWARKTGPYAQAAVDSNLKGRRHPELAYRTCLGILRLAKNYGHGRLEKACRRALYLQSTSYKTINSILENGLEDKPLPGIDVTSQALMPKHDNIRGPEDYH